MSEVHMSVVREAQAGAKQIQHGDEITVHYVGKLQGGNIFDSSRDRGKAFTFMLGAGGVIKGWEQSLPLMKVGEIAKLVIPPHLGYGKKGMPPKIPPNATLEFEIEILSAIKPLVKDILEDTESNVTPKESNYVLINMVVKGKEGDMRDEHFKEKPLEFYMKDHKGQSEPDGRWRAGNLLKKAVEQMRLFEKAAFTISEEIVDKHGNQPFWGSGPVVIEIKLICIGSDEDLNGDGCVVKHKAIEGEGYEKPTDGAKIFFHYRVFLDKPLGATIRDKEDGADVPQSAQGAKKGVDYSKWDNIEVTDDGEVHHKIPDNAQKALDESEAEAKRREANKPVLSTWVSGSPATIIAGYGETAEGIEDALMTMKKGEFAMVKISKEYGFSMHDGKCPIENLPEDATLHIQIQMVEMGKGREHWNLNEEEKLKYGELKRLRGNEFFKRGVYRRALKLYEPLVSETGFFMKMPMRPSESVKQQTLTGEKIQNVATHLKPSDKIETEEERHLKLKLQLPTYLNIAACRMKLGEFKKTIEACDKALGLDENSVKAHFRQGQANVSMANYGEAKKNFSQVLKIEPSNADAQREQARILKLEIEAKKKEKKAFGGFFDSKAWQDSAPEDAEEAQPKGLQPKPPSVFANVDASNLSIGDPPLAEGEKENPDHPRAKVISVKKYDISPPDVAPKVRIAGVVGGGGDDDGDD